ncbi:MAG: hypothetical protein R3F62_19195 [Planctomycetota bacterium]
MSGTVVAKDGQMIAIGGLIEGPCAIRGRGSPWLSEIPILGFFFRRQETERVRQELVITLTPHVLTTPQGRPRTSAGACCGENSVHPSATTPS